MNGTVAPLQENLQWTVISVEVDTIDSLFVQAANARCKTATEHGEGGEVNLGVAMRIRIVLLQSQVTLIVEQAVEDIGSIPVSAFDGRTVERSIVISDERVELQSVIAETMA